MDEEEWLGGGLDWGPADNLDLSIPMREPTPPHYLTTQTHSPMGALDIPFDEFSQGLDELESAAPLYLEPGSSQYAEMKPYQQDSSIVYEQQTHLNYPQNQSSQGIHQQINFYQYNEVDQSSRSLHQMQSSSSLQTIELHNVSAQSHLSDQSHLLLDVQPSTSEAAGAQQRFGQQQQQQHARINTSQVQLQQQQQQPPPAPKKRNRPSSKKKNAASNSQSNSRPGTASNDNSTTSQPDPVVPNGAIRFSQEDHLFLMEISRQIEQINSELNLQLPPADRQKLESRVRELDDQRKRLFLSVLMQQQSSIAQTALPQSAPPQPAPPPPPPRPPPQQPVFIEMPQSAQHPTFRVQQQPLRQNAQGQQPLTHMAPPLQPGIQAQTQQQQQFFHSVSIAQQPSIPMQQQPSAAMISSSLQRRVTVQQLQQVQSQKVAHITSMPSTSSQPPVQYVQQMNNGHQIITQTMIPQQFQPQGIHTITTESLMPAVNLQPSGMPSTTTQQQQQPRALEPTLRDVILKPLTTDSSTLPPRNAAGQFISRSAVAAGSTPPLPQQPRPSRPVPPGIVPVPPATVPQAASRNSTSKLRPQRAVPTPGMPPAGGAIRTPPPSQHSAQFQHQRPNVAEIGKIMTSPMMQSIPLVPRLSQAECSQRIAEKSAQRACRLHDAFSKLASRIGESETEKPFSSTHDVVMRLLPYGLFNEPDFKPEVCEAADHFLNRKFLGLSLMKDNLIARLRRSHFDESSRNHYLYEQDLMLYLDTEYEKRKLENEKNLTMEENGKDKLIAESKLIVPLLSAGINPRSSLPLQKPAKSTSSMQYEYRSFDESIYLNRPPPTPSPPQTSPEVELSHEPIDVKALQLLEEEEKRSREEDRRRKAEEKRRRREELEKQERERLLREEKTKKAEEEKRKQAEKERVEREEKEKARLEEEKRKHREVRAEADAKRKRRFEEFEARIRALDKERKDKEEKERRRLEEIRKAEDLQKQKEEEKKVKEEEAQRKKAIVDENEKILQSNDINNTTKYEQQNIKIDMKNIITPAGEDQNPTMEFAAENKDKLMEKRRQEEEKKARDVLLQKNALAEHPIPVGPLLKLGLRKPPPLPSRGNQVRPCRNESNLDEEVSDGSASPELGNEALLTSTSDFLVSSEGHEIITSGPYAGRPVLRLRIFKKRDNRKYPPLLFRVDMRALCEAKTLSLRNIETSVDEPKLVVTKELESSQKRKKEKLEKKNETSLGEPVSKKPVVLNGHNIGVNGHHLQEDSKLKEVSPSRSSGTLIFKYNRRSATLVKSAKDEEQHREPLTLKIPKRKLLEAVTCEAKPCFPLHFKSEAAIFTLQGASFTDAPKLQEFLIQAQDAEQNNLRSEKCRASGRAPMLPAQSATQINGQCASPEFSNNDVKQLKMTECVPETSMQRLEGEFPAPLPASFLETSGESRSGLQPPAPINTRMDADLLPLLSVPLSPLPLKTPSESVVAKIEPSRKPTPLEMVRSAKRTIPPAQFFANPSGRKCRPTSYRPSSSVPKRKSSASGSISSSGVRGSFSSQNKKDMPSIAFSDDEDESSATATNYPRSSNEIELALQRFGLSSEITHPPARYMPSVNAQFSQRFM